MENNKITQELFTENFRPKTLETAIIVPRIREELSRGVVDNILLAGSAGAGKTTLTRILSKGYDTLTINASLERGIDIIRDKVITFASSSSLFDGHEQLKIIVLEECDNMTLDAWKSLRSVMETYHKSVRFIANCNYLDKIPEPIQSRFNCICINPITKDEEEYLFSEYKNRISKILTFLKIGFTEENLEVFVRNSFPDMRSLIKKVQQLYTRGAAELTPDMLTATFDCTDLYNIILNAQQQPWNNYKALCGEWANKADDAILNIGKHFVEYMHTAYPQLDAKIPVCLIKIAQYQSMLPTAIDKFVVLEGLVFELQQIIQM